jgi:uncharacterized protein
MNKYQPRFLLSLLLCLFLSLSWSNIPAAATEIYELPILAAGDSTYIVDNAEVISISNEGALNDKLKQLARDTGTEVRMVTIRRLNYDTTIDSFTEELFNQWYPDAEANSSQVLIVLDTLSNRAAIRTGAGVKDTLTDEIALSVATETTIVPIRNGGKYNQALIDASDRLAIVLSGEPDPGAPVITENLNIESNFTKEEDTDRKGSTVWVVVLLLLATIIPMVTYYWYVGLPGR